MFDAALLKLGRSLLAPSDSGDVVEWCEDNVLPSQTRRCPVRFA